MWFMHSFLKDCLCISLFLGQTSAGFRSLAPVTQRPAIGLFGVWANYRWWFYIGMQPMYGVGHVLVNNSLQARNETGDTVGG